MGELKTINSGDCIYVEGGRETPRAINLSVAGMLKVIMTKYKCAHNIPKK